MKQKIGKFKSSIADLKLTKQILNQNTLILAEAGSGKTHLSNTIREYVMDSDVPTLYLDFSDPDIDDVEARFKESGRFYYMRFDESDTFDTQLQEAIARREQIYMAVNKSYFANKRDIKSRLSQMLQKKELLENYYYFFHEISMLNPFYSKFEDFMFYIFDLINMKKYVRSNSSSLSSISANALTYTTTTQSSRTCLRTPSTTNTAKTGAPCSLTRSPAISSRSITDAYRRRRALSDDVLLTHQTQKYNFVPSYNLSSLFHLMIL